MSDLFLSYSRRDDAFARRMHDALNGAGQDVWADWEDIAPTADWMATIYEAIEDADAFVFVLSPDSVESEICGRELAHAAGLNKRIIPVLLRDVDPKIVPEPAARHQWIGFACAAPTCAPPSNGSPSSAPTAPPSRRRCRASTSAPAAGRPPVVNVPAS